MEKKNRLGIELRNIIRLGIDLRLSAVFKLKEEDFLKIIKEIESDALFLRLSAGGKNSPPAITKTRIRNSCFAWSYGIERLVQTKALDSSVSPGDILGQSPGAVKLIQRIGPENFENFFLGNESFSLKDTAEICRINENERRMIRDFVNRFLSVYENLPLPELPGLGARLVAIVSKNENGLRIEYTSPHYASGIYAVNMEALKQIKKAGALSPGESKHLNRLLDMIKIVNWKKTGLHKVIEGILKFHGGFFYGTEKELKPLSQRMLAGELRISPSSVSRIIYQRSIKIPDGGEMMLKDFFVPKKDYIIGKIKQTLSNLKGKHTDSEIAGFLCSKYGLKVPRRTVNYYRKELT